MSFIPGWKILKDDRSYHATWDNAVMNYQVGKWVERKRWNGPLATFDSLYNAICFDQCMYKVNTTIYKCLYIPSVDQQFWYVPDWIPARRLVNKGIPMKFCGTITASRADSQQVYEYPKGTCFADAVMLIGDENEIHNRAYVWT